MDRAEVDRFGALFEKFLSDVVHIAHTEDGQRERLVDRIETFLGADPLDLPVISETFAGYEHTTVQVAVNRLLARDGVEHELIGTAGGGREHESLSEILQGSRMHRGYPVGAVDYLNLAVSADEEMACVRFGCYLIDDGDRKLVVLLRGASRHGDLRPGIEVVAVTKEDAQSWLADLRNERAACNVLRGQVVSFEPREHDPSATPVRFHHRPDLRREDVVMPDGVLERIERQVTGVGDHRDRLRSEGRHLKRGALLYGPPGTGKTHTVRYLLGASEGVTVVLLAGPAIQFVADACELARTLQPALIVLEDVDLVAEDRSYRRGGHPLLYTILDQMDGLTGDADVCFLLTTNRADLLETALAQRPGRVDLAVEIPLPDETGRARLLATYGSDIELSEGDVDAIVERTAGAPASLIKELTRRASLLSAVRGVDVTTADDLRVAVEELMTDQEAFTRSLLGASPPADLGAENGDDSGEPEPGVAGWYADSPHEPRSMVIGRARY